MSTPITFERRVVSGLDDVEQAASGKMSLASSDPELVTDGNTVQTVGLRFTGIAIPQGAVITNAYIQFQTDDVGSGATSLLIRGEDSDDAAAFTNVTNNVSSRPKTDASVGWSPAAWTKVGEAGLAQRTSDLSAIVQEIVSRAGWTGSATDDMAFIITGTGRRTAEILREWGRHRAAIAGLATLITDTDDTHMERATLTLTNAQAGDQLSVNAAGLPVGITVDPSSMASNVIRLHAVIAPWPKTAREGNRCRIKLCRRCS